MTSRKSLSVAGAGLMGLGIGVLLTVAGLWLYSRLEAWTETQTRLLDSATMIWPEAPPLTLLPPPLPTRASTRAAAPTRAPTMTPTRQAVAPALLTIPRLKVKRAIVTIDRVKRDGKTEWDTDSLYATRNRSDLVGHLKGTGSLGSSGNVVLAGHNYNRGRYNWLGVFYDVKRLDTGDIIYVDSEQNERYAYEVVQVEKVNWPPRTDTDMKKHIEHLSATSEETLTLVTCGGANLAPFPARIYVTASRLRPAAPPTRQPSATATAGAAATATTRPSATLTPKPAATATAASQPGATSTRQVIAPSATSRIQATPVPVCRAIVTVRRGETLAMIARAHGVSMRSLAQRNGITNPDHIYAGWRLCIP